MKVRERYATSRDASQQLHNTYVVLDGTLCHIECVDGWVYNIRSATPRRDGALTWKQRREEKSIKEMDLQLEPIKLGYVNYSNTAVYLQRKPLRKWKQGLYAEYLKIKSSASAGLANGVKRGAGIFNTKTVVASRSFLDMYADNYPSFYRAWVQVRLLHFSSAAFHRNWAFTRARSREAAMFMGGGEEYHLEYKGTRVGKIEEDEVVLNNEYKYLSEDFVEAMVNAS
jgi:hypothetical protein